MTESDSFIFKAEKSLILWWSIVGAILFYMTYSEKCGLAAYTHTVMRGEASLHASILNSFCHVLIPSFPPLSLTKSPIVSLFLEARVWWLVDFRTGSL